MVTTTATLQQLVAETGWLRRLALALVKDQATADDLVQDTYVIAATQAPSDGRAIRPWLARVLWNRVRMRSRTARRRHAREDKFGQLAVAPARPDEIVDHIKLQRLLAGFVLELAAQERDVLLLHYYEGLTSSQIGQRLGVSASTVRWRLKRAVDELRQRLDRDNPTRAWVPALAGFARGGAKTTTSMLVPALLLLGFIAIAIVAVVLHSQVGASSGPTYASSQIRAEVPPPAVPSDPEEARKLEAAHELPEMYGVEHRRVAGRVVDVSDRGVEGAEVRVSCGFDDALAAPVQTTDASGAFAFDIDPLCRYEIQASKGALRGESGWFLHQTKIRVRQLPRVAIRVIDAEGAPVEGAVVTASWGVIIRSSSTTGADGIARVDADLPAYLAVEAPHYVHARRKVEDPAPHREASAPPPDVQIEVALDRGIVVAGTAVDPEGHPVGDAGVTLARGFTTVYVRSDAAGRFEARVPANGRYALSASTESLTSASPEPIDVPLDGKTDVVAHLQRHGQLTGTVVDLSNRPVAGAKVTLHDGGGPVATTDAHGQFMLKNVDGRQDVIARKGAFASAYQHVETALGEHAEVTLQVGPTGISGTTVDRAGQPVAGAYVWLNFCCDNSPGLVSGTGVVSDASGKFELETPRGDFRLSVKRDEDDDYLEEDDLQVPGGSHDVRVVVP